MEEQGDVERQGLRWLWVGEQETPSTKSRLRITLAWCCTDSSAICSPGERWPWETERGRARGEVRRGNPYARGERRQGGRTTRGKGRGPENSPAISKPTVNRPSPSVLGQSQPAARAATQLLRFERSRRRRVPRSLDRFPRPSFSLGLGAPVHLRSCASRQAGAQLHRRDFGSRSSTAQHSPSRARRASWRARLIVEWYTPMKDPVDPRSLGEDDDSRLGMLLLIVVWRSFHSEA